MVVWPAVTVERALGALALQGVAQRNMQDILWWGGVLLVMGLAFGGGIMALRRRVLPKAEHPPEQTWSLQDLRRMRETSELSEEEFETLRARLIARMGRAASADRDRGEQDTTGPGQA